MTKHRIFMDLVHEHVRRLSTFSQQPCDEEGRGVLYVNPDEWLEVVARRRDPEGDDDLIAFCYFPQGRIDGVDLDAPGMGFEEIAQTCDSLKTFVRLVNHRSDFPSCYLIQPEPGDAADV